MDRQIVKSGQVPLETDILNAERSTLIALGKLAEAVLGNATLVAGLACTPTAPASLSVNMGAGQIFTFTSVNASSYSTLPADTVDQIVKQGLFLPGSGRPNESPASFTMTAPSTSGFSQNYLIEATFDELDDTGVVRPYQNNSNPPTSWPVALSGPGGSGAADNTFRRDYCLLQVKAGTPAATGTQATPTPDAGFVGLYSITVANGQSTITAGNITQLSSAPFVPVKLGNVPAAVQNGTWTGFDDSSGVANSVVITPSPVVAGYVKYQKFRVKIANTNTAASTLNVGGLGAKAIVLAGGAPLIGGEMVAGGISEFVYDGTSFELTSVQANARQKLNANLTLYVATTGNDSNNGLTSGAPFLTLQRAWTFIQRQLDLNGFVVTVQVANGTYTAGVAASGPVLGATGETSIVFQGSTVPGNVGISASGTNCFSAENGAAFTVQGMLLNATGTSSAGINVNAGGIIMFASGSYPVAFGTMPSGNHISANFGGYAYANGAYSITNNAQAHMSASFGGNIDINGAGTVTLTGTPAFSSAFAVASGLGIINAASVDTTFSGSATGVRYTANDNGLIFTAGSSATYLPGNSAGTTASGGVYG